MVIQSKGQFKRKTAVTGVSGDDMSVSTEEIDVRLHPGGDIYYITNYSLSTQGQFRVSDIITIEVFVSPSSWATSSRHGHWQQNRLVVLHGFLFTSGGGRSQSESIVTLETRGSAQLRNKNDSDASNLPSCSPGL